MWRQEKNIIVPSGLSLALCSDSVSKVGYALLTTHQEDTCFSADSPGCREVSFPPSQGGDFPGLHVCPNHSKIQGTPVLEALHSSGCLWLHGCSESWDIHAGRITCQEGNYFLDNLHHLYFLVFAPDVPVWGMLRLNWGLQMAAKADRMAPGCWHLEVKGKQMPDKDNQKHWHVYVQEVCTRAQQGSRGGSSENWALIWGVRVEDVSRELFLLDLVTMSRSQCSVSILVHLGATRQAINHEVPVLGLTLTYSGLQSGCPDFLKCRWSGDSHLGNLRALNG